MADEDAARVRLGRLVMRQRTALGMSVRAAARKAGVDRATWTGLEDGTRTIQDRNYAKIERALEWAPDSIMAILAGGMPVDLGELPPQGELAPPKPVTLDPLKSSPEEIAEFLEEVRQYQGEEAFQELFQQTLQVNMQDRAARERAEEDRGHGVWDRRR